MTIAFITSQTSLISWFKNALARIQWDLRSRYCVHSISHLLFSRHRINVGPDPCRKGSITGNETKTPTHTTPGGACPTLSAQCGPICTRNPSQPQRPLPLAFITPVAWSGERPSLHRKNLQEETSLWDNLLVSRESPLPPYQRWPGINSPVLRRWEPGPDSSYPFLFFPGRNICLKEKHS